MWEYGEHLVTMKPATPSEYGPLPALGCLPNSGAARQVQSPILIGGVPQLHQFQKLLGGGRPDVLLLAFWLLYVFGFVGSVALRFVRHIIIHNLLYYFRVFHIVLVVIIIVF